MDFPFLLLVLLALPVLAAALILAASAVRRSRRTPSDEPADEGVHRLQADSAAVQDTAARPSAGGREVTPARERRAASARKSTHE